MSEQFNLDALANMYDDDFIGKSYVENQSNETDVDIPNSSNEEIIDNQTDEVVIDEFQQEEQEMEYQEEQPDITNPEQEEPEEQDEEQETDEVTELTQNSDELLAKLFTPFNANGTQIKVDTVEEAVELMQMGANYHKKMHTLKPHLRFIKALEGKGLLQEEKLNFVIDLMSGDKKAINKLLADGNIDPLDLNTDESKEYSPVNHVESEQSHNLAEVLAEVQTLPQFKETMDVVTTQWDSTSKQMLTAHPERIKLLMAHKANGTFDLINAEVARMRMFGQLPLTTSDMDAYEQVGKLMMQRQAQQQPTKVPAPETKPNTDLKKRIVSPKSSPAKAATTSIDKLSELSDEEFLKVSSKYF